MLIVPVKEGENIERALKKFKKKFERTGTVRQLRARQQFDKPSIIRREQIKKAIYVEKMQREEEA
ncbi:30S ribosomal protein S21 [Vicingaceae bacterium]|jgi:small subunit ribosomal protein S21|nr:30S ribosomal protein S21 [Vicingaceae bacterium]MDB9963613.1 30S ribosomal protein S21 [Vicingaceae bacterium]MDC1451316.1 30S ribosomal protein S21 [Vicingaceae bacterium]|tara:strand:- start:1468 stop:1662 length:195 start_codon:yes stop_codon:yes gene_type:complete